MSTRDAPDGHETHDNGLRAVSYVPLTDIDPEVGRQLLTALARARIAAYLGQTGDEEQLRLFVAAEERVDARTIVRATVRALGSSSTDVPDPVEDPLAGLDTDAVFAALIADWHVDTHVAIRNAERDLTREDSDWRARLAKPPADEEPEWLDDDHYVPPPPPPLPRLSGTAILGIVIMLISIFLLAAGTIIGLADNFARLLGIGGLLVGTGILLTRVRDFHRDEDDDGSAV